MKTIAIIIGLIMLYILITGLVSFVLNKMEEKNK